MSIESYEFTWTDGSNGDFRKFYLMTEEYYSKIVGGEKNRIVSWTTLWTTHFSPNTRKVSPKIDAFWEKKNCVLGEI